MTKIRRFAAAILVATLCLTAGFAPAQIEATPGTAAQAKATAASIVASKPNQISPRWKKSPRDIKKSNPPMARSPTSSSGSAKKMMAKCWPNSRAIRQLKASHIYRHDRLQRRTVRWTTKQ